jgi:WG containing repeat
MIIPPRFDTAEPFSDGLAVVSADDQFGYIDPTGTYVIPPQYSYAESFSEGRAVVGDDDEYWYIGHDGRQAIPGTFDLASAFFKGLAHVAIAESDSFAYIDRNGKRVFIYKP